MLDICLEILSFWICRFYNFRVSWAFYAVDAYTYALLYYIIFDGLFGWHLRFGRMLAAWKFGFFILGVFQFKVKSEII